MEVNQGLEILTSTLYIFYVESQLIRDITLHAKKSKIQFLWRFQKMSVLTQHHEGLRGALISSDTWSQKLELR